MVYLKWLLTPIKVSVGPPKEAPIILLLWGLAVYFCVGRCWFTAVSVAGLVLYGVKYRCFSLLVTYLRLILPDYGCLFFRYQFISGLKIDVFRICVVVFFHQGHYLSGAPCPWLWF